MTAISIDHSLYYEAYASIRWCYQTLAFVDVTAENGHEIHLKT